MNIVTRQEMLERLPASRLANIGRACDLVWLIFNDGEELPLHLQCAWRLTVGDAFRLASGDVYEQPAGQEYDEDFDWDVQGKNRFDHAAADLKKELPLTVRAVHLSAENDLEIRFDRGTLRVFAEQPINKEAWRFFVHHSDTPHLVAIDGKLEEQ